MRIRESTSDYFIGVDLGQKHDFTALCVVERLVREWDQPADRVSWQRLRDTSYRLRYLSRIPLGTPYPAVVEKVMKLVKNPNIIGPRQVVVDATGVGGAVFDMLRAAWPAAWPTGLLVPLTITGGPAPVQSGVAWSVPKRDLLIGLQVMFEKGELRIAGNVPAQAVFLKELAGMQVKQSASGHHSYGSRREEDHDDLVLAVAMACWRAKSYVQWDLHGSQRLPGI